MADVDTRTVPTADELLDDSDTVHVTCCDDDDLTLCGVDASNFDIVDERTGCVVCAELEDTGFCPKGLNCDDPWDGLDIVTWTRRFLDD